MVNFVREISTGVKIHDMEQHLGQKLVYSRLELEKLKAEAREEIRRNKECVNQLIHLLKLAIQERDEARNQVQKLLNKTMNPPNVPLFQANADSPLLILGKPNSSVTESNSLLETYNYQSHGSSPVDSLFDAVSSPEFSNINLVVQNTNHVPCEIDQDSLIIENLVKGRAMPQKGKFLQSVLEAGPLLQTLLVAGPLPRWRNPPQNQSFQVPPVLIRNCEAEASNIGYKSLNSLPCAKSTQAPMLNFAANISSGNGSLLSSGTNANGCVSLGKRHRLS